mmetsp:Transcript_58950/g.172563  ORF Transcript_58950/g.172563 Transcript_58950/m.172563 type:complete len:213 (+) Transcript_58950:211-849(+)
MEALGMDRFKLLLHHLCADSPDVVNISNDGVCKLIEAFPTASKSSQSSHSGLQAPEGGLGAGHRWGAPATDLRAELVQPSLQALRLPRGDHRLPGLSLVQLDCFVGLLLGIVCQALQNSLRGLWPCFLSELHWDLNVVAEWDPAHELIHSKDQHPGYLCNRQVISIKHHLIPKVDRVGAHRLSKLFHALQTQVLQQPCESSSLAHEMMANIN